MEILFASGDESVGTDFYEPRFFRPTAFDRRQFALNLRVGDRNDLRMSVFADPVQMADYVAVAIKRSCSRKTEFPDPRGETASEFVVIDLAGNVVVNSLVVKFDERTFGRIIGREIRLTNAARRVSARMLENDPILCQIHVNGGTWRVDPFPLERVDKLVPNPFVQAVRRTVDSAMGRADGVERVAVDGGDNRVTGRAGVVVRRRVDGRRRRAEPADLSGAGGCERHGENADDDQGVKIHDRASGHGVTSNTRHGFALFSVGGNGRYAELRR